MGYSPLCVAKPAVALLTPARLHATYSILPTTFIVICRLLEHRRATGAERPTVGALSPTPVPERINGCRAGHAIANAGL